MMKLYCTQTAIEIPPPSQTVRWLSVDEFGVFQEHLKLCEQHGCGEAKWKEAYWNGTVYCGLFVGEKMVSRACVEKYSEKAWEVADVRTAKPYRGNGYALHVCAFVLQYILAQGKMATIRTADENASMKKVIEKLGFAERKTFPSQSTL